MIEDEKIYKPVSETELIKMFQNCVMGYEQSCKDCIMLRRFKDMIMLYEHLHQYAKVMRGELRAAKSCEICIHKDHCDPHAPYESPQWKMWRTCGETEKKNYRWRGDKE